MTKTKTKKRARRFPAFRDDAEERKFWETHKPGDYLTQTRPAHVQVAKQLSERVRSRSRRLRQTRAG